MKIELTANEWSVLHYVLNSVNDAMSWDASYQSYIDNGNIICTLDKGEMKALKSMLKKL